MLKKSTLSILSFCIFPLFLLGQGTIPPGGGSVTGSTVGQGNDCAQRSTADYYYSFTPELDACGGATYTVSTCSTPILWDSFLYLYDGIDCTTSSILASNDDACTTLSEFTYAFTPGVTYYIYVEGFNSDGNYTLDVFPSASPPTPSGDLWLLGEATASAEPGCYDLTQDAIAQTSCIWQNTSSDFSTPFAESFTINLGSNDAGADGMTLVYQGDPLGNCACGTGGESLSYGGAGAITNSLIFEVDTYINTEDRDDFSFPCVSGSCSDPDHSAIHINGIWQNPVFDAVPLMDGAVEYDIENGIDHLLIVNWDGTTITFSITNLAQSTTYVSLSYAFDPLVLFGTNTPLNGFTASTGGLTNLQSVCIEPSCLGSPQFIKN